MSDNYEKKRSGASVQSIHANRRLERVHVYEDVVVKDMLQDISLGKLVNIHLKGFMLIGDSHVKENRLYQLTFSAPDIFNSFEKILIGAECLWVREADDEQHQWAGFQIIDINKQGLQAIEVLSKAIEER